MRAATILVLFGLACTRGPGAPPPHAQTLSAQSVYRDPATGRFGAPPAGASMPAPAQLSTPAPALREMAGPRGGWMVRLDGRFHSQVTAERPANGPVTTACDQARP